MDTTQYKALSALREWQDNYNKNDISRIALSIRRFGMNNALRVWRDEIVMAGNHTMKALRLIREEGPRPEIDHHWPPENILLDDNEWYVPYISVLHLTDENEVRAFAIADNALAKQATTDDELLARYLQEIANQDAQMLAATGYNEDDLDKLLAQLADEITGGPDLDGGDRYQEQYGVIVICSDEAHQQEVYNDLLEAGYNVKVVVT